MPLEPSDKRRAAGGSHVGMSSAYIQLSLRAKSSAVREALSSADSEPSAEDREAAEAWRLCHGVEPAEECEEREWSERRRKRPEAGMRLLAGLDRVRAGLGLPRLRPLRRPWRLQSQVRAAARAPDGGVTAQGRRPRRAPLAVLGLGPPPRRSGPPMGRGAYRGRRGRDGRRQRHG